MGCVLYIVILQNSHAQLRACKRYLFRHIHFCYVKAQVAMTCCFTKIENVLDNIKFQYQGFGFYYIFKNIEINNLNIL